MFGVQTYNASLISHSFNDVILAFSNFGAIQVLRNAFFWKLNPHLPPRNANNIEPYTFVTLFTGKFDTPPPQLICVVLRYITLEWPLCFVEMLKFNTGYKLYSNTVNQLV